MKTEKQFWQLLSDGIRKHCGLNDYKQSKKLTGPMTNIAGHVIYDQYLKKPLSNSPYHPYVSKEFYNVDVLGYYTKWYTNQNKPSEERQSDWILEVAFEHENNPKTWHEELCKLCYLCANLKVIVSYYEENVNIEDLLKQYLHSLGRDKLFIYPASKWLFVFGPSGVNNYKKPFRAFSVSQKFEPSELKIDKPLIPDEFNKIARELEFPDMTEKQPELEV